MYKTGHYGAALLLYAPVGVVLLSVDPALAVLGGVGSVGLSRVPDYDLRIPGLKHRGVTHTVAFLCLIAAALAGLGLLAADTFGTSPTQTAGLGLVVGVVAIGSHLAADALTPAGVPLWWPLSSRRYTVGVTKASNPLANYGLLALGIAVTVGVGYLAGAV